MLVSSQCIVLTVKVDTLLLDADYLGCVIDNNTRDMPYKAVSTGATVPTCRDACALNSTYAGLQYGEECWCGNSFGTYGGAPESDCDMVCSGTTSRAPTDICGSNWRNSVWRSVPGNSTNMDAMIAIPSFVKAWEGPCVWVFLVFFT
jgi:hypothetical protein